MTWETIGDIVERMVEKMGNDNKQEDTMRDDEGKRVSFNTLKRHYQSSGGEFLMKRGLPRDKASYVTLLVRFRHDLQALARLASDTEVVDAIKVVDGCIAEEVKYVYDVVEAKNGGR